MNWGRYTNPKVDYLIEQALQQVNDENRTIMLQRATDLAMQDLGIMPIHFQFTMWATKKNVQYTPRTDEYTLAFQFKPLDKMAGRPSDRSQMTVDSHAGVFHGRASSADRVGADAPPPDTPAALSTDS